MCRWCEQPSQTNRRLSLGALVAPEIDAPKMIHVNLRTTVFTGVTRYVLHFDTYGRYLRDDTSTEKS